MAKALSNGDVSGSWKFEKKRPPCGPQGEPSLPTVGQAHYAFHGPGACIGQLIAKWGNGSAFYLGKSGIKALTGDDAGMLYVAINDDHAGALGAGLGDNEGYLTVKLGYAP